MAINKNFVIKNGIQVNDNLLVADPINNQIGINTALPDYDFHVIGGIGVTQARITGVTTSLGDLLVGTEGTALAVKVSAGNSVGIGTNLPEYPLHVRGPASSGTIAGYVYGDLEVTGDFSSANFSSGSASFSGVTTFTNTTQNTLGNADTGAVQIDGGLGINKNVTVGGGLSVTGNSYFVGMVTFAAGASGTIQLGDNASDNVVFNADVNSNIIPNTTSIFNLGSSSQEWRDLHLAGNAGIGSLAVAGISTFIGIATFASGVGIADSIYHIDDSNTSIRFPADNTFTIETNGSERVRVVSDGSVGIGTTIPYKTLDVRGDTIVSGNVGIGSTIPSADLDVVGDTELDSVNVSIAATIKSLSVGTLGQTLVGITTILDEDNMASDSATALATQQSIKAYVDTQVTAQDLDFQGDLGGAQSVDLDSQSLTISGTSNEIETTGSAQTLTIGLPNAVQITTSLDVPTVEATNLKAKDGTSAITITDGTGNVGIGSTLPITDLDVRGSAIVSDSVGIGTTIITSSTSLDVRGNTYISGNLGIGTTSPAGQLQVGQTGGSNIIITPNTGLDINDGVINLYTATSNVDAAPFIISTDVGGTETEKLRVTAGGNIGIGTTNPEETLDVRGDTYVSGSVGIGTTFVTPFTTLDVRGDTYISGNVGIGSTIPRAPLDVSGDVLVGGGLSVTGNSYFVGIVTFAAGTDGNIVLGDTSTDNVIFNADVNSNLIPNTTGAYDLGSSSQKWRNLYVATSVASSTISASTLTENRIVYVGAGSTLTDSSNLTFNGSSVGIGTTIPYKTLDVRGDTIVSSSVGIGTTSVTTDITLDVRGDTYISGSVGIGSTIPSANLDVVGDTQLDNVYVSAASTLAGITSFTKEENNTLGTWNSGPVQFHGGVGIRSDVTVGGGLTVANIHTNTTTTQILHVGSGGTTLTVDADAATFAIGSATTTVTATMNGGAIPSIGLVIALGS